MGLTLVLVRHGETDWTASGRYCGRRDVPLNEIGRSQATTLAPLAEQAFDSVWTSPLGRCVETAAIMGLDAVPVDALQEFDFGAMEGKRWDDLDPTTQAALIAFDGFEAPEGESVSGFADRIDSFVAGLGAGRHLLITHGGVIRHLLRQVGRDEHVPAGSAVVVER